MAAGELAYADVEIERDASACYSLLCDVSRLPEWVTEIATVTVVDALPDGRAAVAEFVTMPGSGSLSYRLAYRYDDGERIVRWSNAEAADREVRGEAWVEPLGAGRCRVRYGLFTSVSGASPFWAQQALEKDQPAAVAAAFRRWLDRQQG